MYFNFYCFYLPTLNSEVLSWLGILSRFEVEELDTSILCVTKFQFAIAQPTVLIFQLQVLEFWTVNFLLSELEIFVYFDYMTL